MLLLWCGTWNHDGAHLLGWPGSLVLCAAVVDPRAVSLEGTAATYNSNSIGCAVRTCCDVASGVIAWHRAGTTSRFLGPLASCHSLFWPSCPGSLGHTAGHGCCKSVLKINQDVIMASSAAVKSCKLEVRLLVRNGHHQMFNAGFTGD